MPLSKPNNGEQKDKFREYRTFNVTELRIEQVTREDAQESPKIVGHAAVFDTIGDGGWFREQIAPGAFTKSIEKDDVRMLFNHNPDFVLGRNKAGTLTMKEDERGLYVENTPPDTQFARDLMTSIDRGDISQMSFGFEIIKEERAESENKGEPVLFTLREVKLWDVSPVTFPFYQQTDVSLHSREAWVESVRESAMVNPALRIALKRREMALRYGKA